MRLDPWEQVLQVVNVAEHDLHNLKPILRRVCAPKGKDSCALWQPSHMDLQVRQQSLCKHQLHNQLQGRQSTAGTSGCGAGVAIDGSKRIDVAI